MMKPLRTVSDRRRDGPARSLALRKAERRRDERIWAQLSETVADVLPALAHRNYFSPSGLQKLVVEIINATRVASDIESFKGKRKAEAVQSQAVEPASASFSAGPRARALLRGREIAEKDLSESGGSYSLEEVRRLLNSVSRQSVEKRVREGRLLAVVGHNNKRFYPAAQFNDDGCVVEGLRAVQDAMATRNGYAVLNFLVNPDPRLGDRKPIDLLKRGEIARVIKAAARIGEQGA